MQDFKELKSKDRWEMVKINNLCSYPKTARQNFNAKNNKKSIEFKQSIKFHKDKVRVKYFEKNKIWFR